MSYHMNMDQEDMLKHIEICITIKPCVLGICQFQYHINFIPNGWLISTLKRGRKHINHLCFVYRFKTSLVEIIGTKEKLGRIKESLKNDGILG